MRVTRGGEEPKWALWQACGENGVGVETREDCACARSAVVQDDPR